METSLATTHGRVIASLTALDAVVLDPFIHDPDAKPTDILSALVKLETYLTHAAQKRTGAVDAYIAVPRQLEHYVSLLENYGFHPTVQGCIVLRRPLVPDTVPLLGLERDATQSQPPPSEGLK